MKICQFKHSDDLPYYYYFLQKVDDKVEIYSFSLEGKTMDTLKLNYTSLGWKNEPLCIEQAVDVSSDIHRRFDLNYNKPHNYKAISELLKDQFGVTQESIDESYGYNQECIDLMVKICKKVKERILDFKYSDLYDTIKDLMKRWDKDKERVTKYVNTVYIPNKLLNYNMCREYITYTRDTPLSYMILRGYFHSDIDDELYDKARELYPDDNDFDKVIYYYNEHYTKEYIMEKYKKDFENR